jgi:4-hydroxy-3-methylbut-2-enyl diphosphate reductase IspH
MVDNLAELLSYDITDKKKAAVVSGASTPKYIVDEIYNYLLSK